MSLAVLFHFLCTQHRHYSKPAARNLQHTTNWERNDRCGNSTTVASSWWWIY